MIRRASAKSAARMKAADHQRLWRMVEGAVVDALSSHPDYLTPKGGWSASWSATPARRASAGPLGPLEQGGVHKRHEGCLPPSCCPASTPYGRGALACLRLSPPTRRGGLHDISGSV